MPGSRLTRHKFITILEFVNREPNFEGTVTRGGDASAYDLARGSECDIRTHTDAAPTEKALSNLNVKAT